MKMKAMRLIALAAAFAIAFSVMPKEAQACNYFSYVGKDGSVVTGRTMDAMNKACEDTMSVRLMPAGQIRKSNSANPLSWTSRYNSIAEYDYNNICFDAMNEKGLVCSGLYLSVSNYGPADGRYTLENGAFTQFVVDNFQSVAEVVNFVQSEQSNFVIVASREPFAAITDDIPMGVHWALTDASGDNCVIEYINGIPTVYRMTGINMAMTNDPPYNEHMSILNHYRAHDMSKNMPGSGITTDRLLRMYAWLDQFYPNEEKALLPELPEANHTWQLRTMARSLTRAISTPYNVDMGDDHRNSSTLWTVNCDPKNGWVCIEHIKSFSMLMLQFDRLDFSKGIQELRLYEGRSYYGDAQYAFTPLSGDFEFGPVSKPSVLTNH